MKILMKLKRVVLLILVTVTLASCGSRYNNPEELAVPIIHGIQADNSCRLTDMLPGVKDINGVFSSNPSEVGFPYFNKYSKSYRVEYLQAHIVNNLDIIRTISKTNNLDWDNVQYSKPEKADATAEGTNYTTVTTILHFDKGGDWEMRYNAVNFNNKWFLFDDIWFGKPDKK